MLYDFDVWPVSVRPEKTNSNLILLNVEESGAVKPRLVSRFRYEETAKAASEAPAPIRIFLENAGFEFAHSPNCVPNGFYDQKDELLRRSLIEQMTELFANKALRKALNRSRQDGNFDFNAFMAYAVTAKPIQLKPDGIVPRIEPRRPNQLQRKVRLRRA